MTIFFTETRERFLTEVAAQIPLERIIEAHLFAPIRQGGVESGVAVIAAGLQASSVDERAVLESETASEGVDGELARGESPRRYRVYTARYRSTLKGPDRGRWEVVVTAEADAPLVTVESVVRGVQHRASDDMPVERFTGEQLMEALRVGRSDREEG